MALIFSFWGSKGGVGKTFCALNFARCIHSELEAKVLLIDGNFPLSVDIKDYFSDLDHDSLDLAMFNAKDKIERSTIDGVDIVALFSGVICDLDGELSEKRFLEWYSKFISEYEYIIIDFGSSFVSESQFLLDNSAHIFLVSDADPISISRLNKDCEYFKNRNFPTHKLSIIINKFLPHTNLNKEWLYSMLGIDIEVLIPVDKDIEKGILAKSSFNKKHSSWPFFQRLVLRIEQIKQLVADKKLDSFGEAKRIYNDDLLKSPQLYAKLKMKIHKRLLEALDLKRTEAEEDESKLKEYEVEIKAHTIEALNQLTIIDNRQLRDKIVADLIKESLYLGVLEDLLADQAISEIMVNRWDTIYVEKSGKIILSDASFLSEQQLMRIIERIVAPLGRRVDISSPLVDARLKDGSRVNVIIPPLAPKGSVVTIRKFSTEALTIENLTDFKTLNEQIVRFLEATVKCKKNLIISGGTGTGKTTTLNILSSFIPETERIITVEDSAELSLMQPHVITLETRPPNIEGKGEITIRDLVKNSLRMRPDRIVVGECRAGETLDMLQAMNTGHDGSMTTVHANSTGESLARLETLVMYAGTDLPSKAVREQIHGAVDIIIQISRLSDGSRKVTQVSEITGIKDGDITYEHIFAFKQKGVTDTGEVYGDFISTGYIPKCLEDFEAKGISIPKEVFWAH